MLSDVSFAVFTTRTALVLSVEALGVVRVALMENDVLVGEYIDDGIRLTPAAPDEKASDLLRHRAHLARTAD